MNKNNLTTLIILDVLVMLLAAGLLIYRFNSISFSPLQNMERRAKPQNSSNFENIKKSFSDLSQDKTEDINKPAKKFLPAATAQTTAPAVTNAPLAVSGKVSADKINEGPAQAFSNNARNIRFAFKHSKAKQVEIIGEFNEWIPQSMTKSKDNLWSVNVKIPPGEYAYNFVIDGQPVRDPNNPKITNVGRGFVNSLLNIKPLIEKGKK